MSYDIAIKTKAGETLRLPTTHNIAGGTFRPLSRGLQPSWPVTSRSMLHLGCTALIHGLSNTFRPTKESLLNCRKAFGQMSIF